MTAFLSNIDGRLLQRQLNKKVSGFGMKNKNKGLHGAKRAKKDEFYTQLVDIENELRHYKDHFRGKTVYCNCDDPEVSNFFKYFSLNFKHLGLKKLITSCYRNDDPSIRTDGVSDKAVWLEYTGEHDEGVVPTAANIGVHAFEGDGDFRSAESIELLKEADIVVTNPPFSIFREYLAQLIEYNKQFIIIGNINAITYKEVFPLLKDNEMWLGYNANKTFEFAVPDTYPLSGTNTRTDNDGNRFIKVPGITWYTNLDISKRHEKLILYKNYTPDEYPTYDNYDAINVDKVANIPLDYDGCIGVPITFLTKYNPDQFEIIGQGQGNLYRMMTDKGLSQQFVDDYYRFGGTGSIKANHPVLGYYSNTGQPVIPYMRLIIKHKK